MLHNAEHLAVLDKPVNKEKRYVYIPRNKLFFNYVKIFTDGQSFPEIRDVSVIIFGKCFDFFALPPAFLRSYFPSFLESYSQIVRKTQNLTETGHYVKIKAQNFYNNEVKMKEEASGFYDIEEIRANIKNKELADIDIFIYEKTNSTNTRARLFAKENENISRAVFIAVSQDEGRGRLGRSFHSDGEVGLYISFLTRDRDFLSDGTLITAKAGVDTVSAIKELSGYGAKIKWVNDIVADGKKLAGILTEGGFSESGELEFAVVGIGINLFERKFCEDIANTAVTVECVSGKRISPSALAGVLINNFFTKRKKEDFMRDYSSLSSVIGTRVKIKPFGKEPFEAFAKRIDDDGALIVQDEHGERRLISAEVEKTRSCD